MSTYSIEDIIQSTDRYKLYALMCRPGELLESIAFIQAQKINLLNIGKELALFIDDLEDYSYLNIDVYDYIKKILEKHKCKINNTGNEILAIYNLGFLLEPALELNAVQLLKEFSLVWQQESEYLCAVKQKVSKKTRK